MGATDRVTVDELRLSLTELADPERATAQRRYMRDQFPYLGLTAPTLRSASRPFIRSNHDRDADDLLELVREVWSLSQREFQYVAIRLLRAGHDRLDARHLDAVEALVRSRSWWDTVDELAIHVVGPLVGRHPNELRTAMDAWIDDDDVWIARTAILHQIGFRNDTDADRLFTYVDRRAADTEFFIRKACGWALREYAKHDPDAVRGYVADRADRLSGLTKREATKHL